MDRINKIAASVATSYQIEGLCKVGMGPATSPAIKTPGQVTVDGNTLLTHIKRRFSGTGAKITSIAPPSGSFMGSKGSIIKVEYDTDNVNITINFSVDSRGRLGGRIRFYLLGIDPPMYPNQPPNEIGFESKPNDLTQLFSELHKALKVVENRFDRAHSNLEEYVQKKQTRADRAKVIATDAKSFISKIKK
jgi:hypothetical protein